MRKLFLRSISGLIYVALVVFACLNPPLGPFLLAISFGITALFEWYSFPGYRPSSLKLVIPLALFSTLLLYRQNWLPDLNETRQFLSVAGVALLAVWVLVEMWPGTKKNYRLFMHRAIGLLYIGLPLLLLSAPHTMFSPWEANGLLGLFALIWLNDTFAFLTGKWLGRRKLWPAVSPNKTWEGWLGGALVSLLGAWLIAPFFSDLPTRHWIALALLVLIFGSLGDLFESAVKRNFALKDSGRFMPGHGGILDRIDSLLFVLPATYIYFLLLG